MKTKKIKKPLTPAQKKAKRLAKTERQKKFTWIFINGKQVRIKRPPTIEGMSVDEFILHNADPIWLHQNELWEYMDLETVDPLAEEQKSQNKSQQTFAFAAKHSTANNLAVETFRTADASDAHVIAQLVNAAYRPQSIARGWTHEADLVSGNRISVDQIVTILSKSDSAILVGSKGTKILACVHVEKHGSDSHIGMLAVDARLQGVGIGKQMLAYAENYAVSYFNARRFSLVVVSSRTELISFYLRRGYRKTGRALDYPQDAGVGTPKSAGLKIETLEKHCASNEPASTSKTHEKKGVSDQPQID